MSEEVKAILEQIKRLSPDRQSELLSEMADSGVAMQLEHSEEDVLNAVSELGEDKHFLSKLVNSISWTSHDIAVCFDTDTLIEALGECELDRPRQKMLAELAETAADVNVELAEDALSALYAYDFVEAQRLLERAIADPLRALARRTTAGLLFSLRMPNFMR